MKETIKAPRHWPLCGEFTGTGEFPAQRASYAENVSIWWRHHVSMSVCYLHQLKHEEWYSQEICVESSLQNGSHLFGSHYDKSFLHDVTRAWDDSKLRLDWCIYDSLLTFIILPAIHVQLCHIWICLKRIINISNLLEITAISTCSCTSGNILIDI